MKNVILVDFDIAGKEWDYKNAIEEITHEKWELKECVTNKLHGSKLKVFLRYFRYFQFGYL